MSDIDPRDFGQLEAKVDKLEQTVENLEIKVDRLLELAAKGRGAWWAGLTIVSALSGAITFFATNFFHK